MGSPTVASSKVTNQNNPDAGFICQTPSLFSDYLGLVCIHTQIKDEIIAENTASFPHTVSSPSFLKQPTLSWAAMCSAKYSLLQTPLWLRWPSTQILGPLSWLYFSPQHDFKYVIFPSLSPHMQAMSVLHHSILNPSSVPCTEPVLAEQGLQGEASGIQQVRCTGFLGKLSRRVPVVFYPLIYFPSPCFSPFSFPQRHSRCFKTGGHTHTNTHTESGS